MTLSTHGPADLGRIFFIAEFAVAVVGWALEINPFDQPNVQEAKDNTQKVLDGGSIPFLEPAGDAELRALLVECLAARSAAEWFGELIAAGVPCGPINSVAEGVAFAAEIGLEPVVVAGHGAAAVPTIRHPLDFSASPPRYDLPPPSLDEHGAQIRGWLATGEAP